MNEISGGVIGKPITNVNGEIKVYSTTVEGDKLFASIEEDDSVQVLMGDEYKGDKGDKGADGLDGRDYEGGVTWDYGAKGDKGDKGADGLDGLDLSGKPEKNTLISMIKSLFVKD